MEIRAAEEGALVTVHVRPRSRRSVDMKGGRLIIGVGAAPVQGRATEEARRTLAEALGVPARTVTLSSGERSRTKVFLVRGLRPEEVSGRFPRPA